MNKNIKVRRENATDFFKIPFPFLRSTAEKTAKTEKKIAKNIQKI